MLCFRVACFDSTGSSPVPLHPCVVLCLTNVFGVLSRAAASPLVQHCGADGALDNTPKGLVKHNAMCAGCRRLYVCTEDISLAHMQAALLLNLSTHQNPPKYTRSISPRSSLPPPYSLPLDLLYLQVWNTNRTSPMCCSVQKLTVPHPPTPPPRPPTIPVFLSAGVEHHGRAQRAAGAGGQVWHCG